MLIIFYYHMGDSKKAIIVGIALVVSAAVFGGFFYSARSASGNDTLSVIGSTKQRVTSDRAKLTVSLSRSTTDGSLSAGYAAIERDAKMLRELLRGNGFTDGEISENPVSMNQIYDQNGPTNRYQVNATVVVQSEDVAKLTEASKKVTGLASQGAIISIQSLEYYYSKLPDLRVSLLTQAVQDAKMRAQKIAEGTGRRVGNVESASAGVVQVLAPNSVDVSDYGSYDTSSIEKDVMVTVKASFRLK